MSVLSALDRIKETRLNKIAEVGLSIAAACLIAWGLVQQHETRLGAVEHWQDAHAELHDRQYRDIQGALNSIQRDLGELVGASKERSR
jgi:hypothetical protein